MPTFFKKWEKDEVDYFIREYQSGTSMQAISKELNRSLASLERKVRDLFISRDLDRRGSGKKGLNFVSSKFVPNEEPKHTDYLRLEGDFLCISDVHVPFWSDKLFNYLWKIAEKFKIKNLILNGDFLNLDSFSTWTTGFRGKEETEKEFKTASFVLLKCLKIFEKIYITQGNHEDRLLRTLMGQVTAVRFFKMINAEIGKKIIVSDYPYSVVNKKWIVGHPKSYSDRGGQTPSDLADKYDMNIITGHNHQWGIQCSKNGKWVGIDHGMGGDPEKIEYHQKNLTKNRTWQQGFSMIYNNHFYCFSLNFTDWDFWINKIKL